MPDGLYSPKCVEGCFCELRHDGVLDSPYPASCIDRSQRAANMPSKGLRPGPLRSLWWALATIGCRDQPMWCVRRHPKTTVSFAMMGFWEVRLREVSEISRPRRTDAAGARRRRPSRASEEAPDALLLRVSPLGPASSSLRSA